MELRMAVKTPAAALVAFALVIFALATRPAAAQCAWHETRVGPTADESRMVYDPVRNRHILYSGPHHETWEWDGAAWHLAATGGPTAVTGFAMTFDRARGVAVLFGGAVGAQLQRETWEWDGKAWSLRSTTGPSARTRAAIAFDETRNVSVLFGGSGRETWEWNGTDWTRAATTGPSARQGHSMVYDAARNVTVLFGAASGGIDETWEWNGSSWTMREDEAIPSGRSQAALVYDRAAGRVLMYGGVLGTAYDDAWSLTSAGWQWLGNTGRPVYGHAGDFDEPSGRMFTYAGTQRQVPLILRRDLAALSGLSWNTLWLALDQQLAGSASNLVGGYDSLRARSVFINAAGAWAFNGQTLEQLPIEGRTSLRNIAFDAASGTFFTAMGSPTGQVTIEETDGLSWQTTATIDTGTFPAGGYVAYDTNRLIRVLVVDRHAAPEGPHTYQTWESTASGWTLRAQEGREVTSIAFDPLLGVVTLKASAQAFASWNGASWADLPSPPGTFAGTGLGSLSYDAANAVTIVMARVVLAQGYTLDGVLAFDGLEWRLIGEPSTPRYPWMAYDAARAVHVTPVWTLNYPSVADFDLTEIHVPTILTQPVDATVPRFSDATFSVTAEADDGTSYEWLRNGYPADELGHRGVHSPTLTVTNVDFYSEATYSVRVHNTCGMVVSNQVQLRLLCGRADWTGDGVVNSTDVAQFINDWFFDQDNPTLIADFDRNDVTNSTDVSEFINTWFAAPPECR
jgi:hypothetical protein